MNIKYLCMLLAIVVSGCGPSKVTDANPRPTTAETTPSLLDGMDLKNAAAVDQHFAALKGVGIEDFAQGIAEVDGWLFLQEEEKAARERIIKEIDVLRTRIVGAITGLSKTALEAPNGKIATATLAKINSLLYLYPSPKNDAERTALEQLASQILNTSRRVEEIRRLRYNEWAIAQIQNALEGYRRELKITGVGDLGRLVRTNETKDALINVCVGSLSSIDPAFLEPAAVDLYAYVFGLTRDAMGNDDERRVKLAKGFANPKNRRRTPADF